MKELMSRPAAFAYAMCLLWSLRLHGVTVTRRRKILGAALSKRWIRGQDLLIAYARQGRKDGVRFCVAAGVPLDRILSSLERAGMTRSNAECLVTNFVVGSA